MSQQPGGESGSGDQPRPGDSEVGEATPPAGAPEFAPPAAPPSAPAPAAGPTDADQAGADPAATGTAQAEETALEQVAWWRALLSDLVSVRTVSIVVALAVILGVGVWGGGDSATAEAEHRGLPVLKADEKIDFGPFEATFKKALVGSELSPIAVKNEGVRYYFVTAELTNTTQEPVDSGYFTECLEPLLEGRVVPFAGGAVYKVPLVVYRPELGTYAAALQPGITYQVVVVIQQNTRTTVSDELTVELSGREHRTNMVYGGEDWMPTYQAFGQLVLSVEPLAEG